MVKNLFVEGIKGGVVIKSEFFFIVIRDGKYVFFGFENIDEVEF